MERRLRNSVLEMAASREFRYTLLNDDLESAYARLKEMVYEEAGRSV
jgi:guanylate kinase